MSLSQLLAEIEHRGYYVILSGPLFKQKEWHCKLEDKSGFVGDFVGTPEDAAGQALLWILENSDEV